MATAPGAAALPLFYNDLVPLSSQAHAGWRVKPASTAPFLAESQWRLARAQREKLFDGDQPSELTKGILAFTEQFEQAGQKTAQFVKELKDLDLLMDGEVSIQPEGAAQPFVYRGFQMVDENKVAELRGDQLRKMAQSGMLPLVYAHLFSLALMRDVFAKQMQQGRAPPQPSAIEMPEAAGA